MDPQIGVSVLHGIQREDDPARFDQLKAELARDTSAYALAGAFGVQSVIAPQQTRAWLIDGTGHASARTQRWHRRARDARVADLPLSSKPQVKSAGIPGSPITRASTMNPVLSAGDASPAAADARRLSRVYVWAVFALTFGLMLSDYLSRQVIGAVIACPQGRVGAVVIRSSACS